MSTARRSEQKRNGQVIVLFALALTAIVLLVGLVIDGGNALAQRRASQNASDFAALAGARIIAEQISGDTTNGTDANVKNSMAAAVVLNGGTPLTFGAANNGPRYVKDDGALLGYVGDGVVPTGAVGVSVNSTRSWTPFFLGIAGFTNWSASAPAVAKGGYAAGGPSGDVFPVGLSEAFLNTYPFCSGDVSGDPSSPCYPQHLTPGNLNVPGGFGWLKFGADGKCTGFGLGMTADGCDSSKPFLQSEIGPPPNSHGCCTQVNGGVSNDANPIDRIGSLTGNKVSADCDYYINNKIVVTVPVWDYAGGTGANGWYHIIGFAGFQLTNCNGGKDIEGVLKRVFFTGPTTSTPGFKGGALAVQLIK